jgi:hypothetical protein
MGLLFVTTLSVFSQSENDPKRFDFGKMWTFENPPKEWFTEAYNFTPGDAWFDDVRKSALRFATWCSASFVSPDGLIRTNHHCSRDVVVPLQLEGEDFDANGFYATTLAEERKAEDLFVEQLLMVADVTNRVHGATEGVKNSMKISQMRDSVLAMIQAEYSEKPEWEDLRLQVVTYYSGGKFSLYGYKKYDDIRLVLIPEGQLGYFGGDPDNFTYPRYNLDCTFWRAYDEDGNPVNSSDNYYEFNTDGVVDGEPVFVVGNPGRTERYRTVAQLEYDRDYRFPIQLEFLSNRHQMMADDYEKNPSVELMNQMLGLSNSMKAFGGILGGLRDDNLMSRKNKMEQSIRTASSDQAPWENLESSYKNLSKHSAALTLLSPNPLKGKALDLMHSAYDYEQALMSGEASEEDLNSVRSNLKELSADLNSEEQRQLLTTLLMEIDKFRHADNDFASAMLKGRSPEVAAKEIIEESWFVDDKKREKLMNLNAKKIAKCDDPFFELGRIVSPAFQDAVTAFRGSSADRRAWEQQVAHNVFKAKGTDLPPDATFTLRIADGVVSGYDYNGTTAPYKTTYYGMYDRYYSNNKVFPWALPDSWMNPAPELLAAPMNFVSTNDIIGGNSGSAIINSKGEAIGLIFDGNIESLPGNFIFDEEKNRSVSVHAGGIIAALKYVYNAERLVKELSAE